MFLSKKKCGILDVLIRAGALKGSNTVVQIGYHGNKFKIFYFPS